MLRTEYPSTRALPKEFYLNEKTEYDFPELDDFEILIFKVSQGAKMWKRNLERYFLQIPLDPADYSKTGFIWPAGLLARTSPPLSAGGIARKGSSSMVRSLTLNYLDDLAGVEEDDKADTAFQKMGQLLSDLGLKEAADKASSPATIITYLGVIFDSIAMRKTVPQRRLPSCLNCSAPQLGHQDFMLIWVARCVRFS